MAGWKIARCQPSQLPKKESHLIGGQPATSVAGELGPLQKICPSRNGSRPGSMVSSTMNRGLQRKVQKIAMVKEEWWWSRIQSILQSEVEILGAKLKEWTIKP